MTIDEAIERELAARLGQLELELIKWRTRAAYLEQMMTPTPTDDVDESFGGTE